MAAGVALITGLLVGLLIAHHVRKAPPARPAVATKPVHAPITVLTPPPAPKPKGPAPGLPAATQFDFYTILPEMHATARPLTRHTQGAAAGAQAPPTNNAAPHAASIVKGRFILQAASFPDIADASRLRAELALRGLGSYIEKVSISGRGAFYRVRIGPLRRTAIAHARHILARLNLKPILLREARGN
ncbi:SPOR domain-containing protein [Acidiferrobacter thiooxydans]|uniref:SPOR domain-containing protein n=1 Tax=Acidiferrobacter thiooxydans TaxID=163359 RepID=UPI000825EC0D|nr:SPOR domain-containing protein [Acidiferrobacter thiooxydans]UEN99650.1 SPOR domain-containing protein [Acidiferrobacter thiooxydans]